MLYSSENQNNFHTTAADRTRDYYLPWGDDGRGDIVFGKDGERSMDAYSELYQRVMEDIRGTVSNTVYNVWFHNLEYVSFTGNTVTLKTDAEFRAQILTDRFMGVLSKSFNNILGFDVDINIISEEEMNAAKKAEKDYLLNGSEYTFENFVVGPSNKFAHAAALAVAANPGKAYNPLFIHGNSGLGKTHLLSAICNEIKHSNPDAYIIYIRSEDFTNELIDYIQNKKDTAAFHNKYRNADVLLIDDIQFIAGKEATQLEFFHTFDVLTKANSQIVLTSDRPPREIALLEDRLRNRFESGLIADVQTPDLETRMAIIKRKAQTINIDLPDEVVLFVAEKIKKNVRQLEGAVKSIQAQVNLHGAPANLATAQIAIKDIFSESTPTPVTVENIIQEVGRTFGVSPENIRSNKRDALTTRARQFAMYLVSEMTGLSTTSIGIEFGGRHHTSVMYSLDEAKKKLASDTSLRATVSDIRKNVENSD